MSKLLGMFKNNSSTMHVNKRSIHLTQIAHVLMQTYSFSCNTHVNIMRMRMYTVDTYHMCVHVA